MRINLKSGNPFTLTEKAYFSARYYMNKGLSKLPKRKPKIRTIDMKVFRNVKPDIRSALEAVIKDPTITALYETVTPRPSNLARGRLGSQTCPVNTRTGVQLLVEEIEEEFNG